MLAVDHRKDLREWIETLHFVCPLLSYSKG